MSRDLSHFEHLLDLLDRERRAEETRFAETQASLTPTQRVAAGVAQKNLLVTDESVGLGGRILVSLQPAGDQGLTMQLDPGACVALRPAPDQTPVSRVTVNRRWRDGLQVSFEHPPPAFVTSGAPLWLELLPNDVSFQRARSAVQAVRAMDQGRARTRRDILLGQKPPRSIQPHPLTPVLDLNPEQREAVERALASEDFFLVHGPPGTGKSTVLSELAVQLTRQGHQVLATAASNAAVDHLLSICIKQGLRAVRVGHPARIAQHLQAHALDALVEAQPTWEVAQGLFDEAYEIQGYARKQRRQGRSRERFSNARAAQSEARTLLQEARSLAAQAAKVVLDDAQVICVTCTALAGSDLAGREFDWVLFDEATQATEPVSAIVYERGRRIVMAGDPCQLPPTVIDPTAAVRGLKLSLFERLLQEHGDGIKALLREQYRMHEFIMMFASETMYGGALRAHPSVAAHTLAALVGAAVARDDGITAPGSDGAEAVPGSAALDLAPMIWVDTAGMGHDEARPEDASAMSESLCNPGEAQLVVEHARALLAAGLGPRDIGVITPYRAQARLLRSLLTRADEDAVEVDTVDAFQGREKEAILLSMTRSNDRGEIGFLSDERRLNVALTRARRHLVIVGDSGTLAAHARFSALLAHVEAVDGYRSGWTWACAS